MKLDINFKNKSFYPENCFSVDHYKYKRFNDKITDLNKDFQIFLDNNKKIEIKQKKNFYNISINNLFKKLVFDSSYKILKKYKKNFENVDKKFYSSKQIQKYKDSKILLLKLIRSKNIDNNNNKSNNDKNTFHNISSINNLNSTFISGKNNNNSYENKMSILANKSFYSHPSSNSFFDVTKRKNTNIKYKKLNIKKKLFNKTHKNKDLIINKVSSNNISDSISNKMSEKEIIVHKKSSKDNFFHINNKRDYSLLNKKINVTRLKSHIHKFEQSSKYFPNNEIIQKYSLQPNKFVRQKFVKKFLIYNYNNKEIDSIINQYNYNRNNSSFKLNKTHISLKIDNLNSNKAILSNRKDNTTMLIKKINDIHKKMKAKNMEIKKEKITSNNKIKKIINYFKKINPNQEDLDEEIKKGISNYYKNIGDFIYANGKYIYSSHLSYLSEGKSLFKH